MLARQELQALAVLRSTEAQALFDAGLFSGSYYLAGYALDLGFKARIAKNFHADAIPERDYVQKVYTHKLETLVGLAGLKNELDERNSSDPEAAALWGSWIKQYW